MAEPCLFEILDLPDEALTRMVRSASTRSLARLVAAYPRVAGRSFLDVISRCMSRPTLEFFREELRATQSPSFDQIRAAELELGRIIQEQQLFAPTSIKKAA